MKMVVVRLGRHPHEVVLLIVCALLGITGLVASDKLSTTTLKTFQPWVLVLWYAGLLVGGVVALTGVTLSSPIVGPSVERIGLMLLAFLCLGYGAAVLAVFQVRGLTFFAFVGGFAIANLLRVRQINFDLNQVLEARARADE